MAADSSLQTFLLLHKAQLVAHIPEKYWETLYNKINGEVYDAGKYFSMAKDENEDWHVLVTTEDGLSADDEDGIFLVDHAWTFEEEHARKILKTAPNLLMRMINLTECYNATEMIDCDNDTLVEEVMDGLWPYCQSYKVAQTIIKEDGEAQFLDDADKKITVWYVMDEFGSRFAHSDNPNMVFKIFFHIPTGVTYTVIYPLKNIGHQEEATRDFVADITDPKQRDARLYPWQPERLNIEEIQDDWLTKINSVEIEERCNEIVPNTTSEAIQQPDDKIFKVYTERTEITHFLTHPRFVLHDDADTADIVWPCSHFKDFKSISETPWKIVTQFASENVLTCKDLLAVVAMRSLKLEGNNISQDEVDNRGPMWLPMTYNLLCELPEFIKCFKEREDRGVNNVWMIKPWNLGRGLGHTVSNNLNQIIKCLDTGPKVACKYIEDLVMFTRDDGVGDVKFDIRYMVVLNSIEPMELYLYKIFYTRFANIEFSFSDFHEYEKHFTVMNYRDSKLKQIHWNDFIRLFEEQNPGQKWDAIEVEVAEIIKKLFKSAVSRAPPNGLGHNQQCRAMYGLDFMFKWKDKAKTEIQPLLIEVNFNPCIERCCKYQKHIVDDFFETMFLGKQGEHMVRLL